MFDTAICISYSHTIKGFYGPTTADEKKFFYLEGFQPETLAEMPLEFLQTIKKTLAHMEKANDCFHEMLDVFYPSDYLPRKTAFRIILQSDGAGHRSYFLLTWPKEAREAEKVEMTKKEILDYTQKFFLEQMVKFKAA